MGDRSTYVERRAGLKVFGDLLPVWSRRKLGRGGRRKHSTPSYLRGGSFYEISQILPKFGIWLKQEIAANYEKYIRARDPFPWRSIHQNLNSLGNSFCSDSNLTGARLCRYNFCTWQVWHETHICCQGMRKICSDDQKMKYDKMKF